MTVKTAKKTTPKRTTRKKPATKKAAPPPFLLLSGHPIRTLPGVSAQGIWAAVGKARKANGDVAGAKQAQANARAYAASAAVSRPRSRAA